jgi:hypothetical protein
MAGTFASDLVIDNELVRLGIVETLEQNVDGFNAASNGTITLTSEKLENDFADESFIKAIAAADLVKRRDYTADTAADTTKLVEDSLNTVKLSRRYGPFETTYDAWNRSNRSVDTFSLALGQQLGIAIQADMLNTLIVAGTAAIGEANTKLGTGAALFEYANIIDGLATFGDKAGRIQMLVMHSNTYFSVVDKGLSMNALENVGGATIREGGAYSLGLPVLVTDSPALISDANGTGTAGDSYLVLGLTADALKAIESDETIMKSQDVLLGENLKHVIQGESSYNVGVKGCKYDTTAGANPDDATLGTGANWSYVFTDVKSGPGFVLELKARA